MGGSKPQLQQEQEYHQTDAGLFIGQHYRDAGFGHRVCQIYCDSRDWDTAAYPSDFFDSALIDGGHIEEVVASDTRKALSVTRSGGLIMWHDFCPDPARVRPFPICCRSDPRSDGQLGRGRHAARRRVLDSSQLPAGRRSAVTSAGSHFGPVNQRRFTRR